MDESLCDVLSSIPMRVAYPSLNLSHSVMIYAYELAGYVEPTVESSLPENRNGEVFRAIKEQSSTLLQELQMPEQQPGLHQRIVDKVAMMNESDSRLVLSLLRYLRRLKH